MLIYIFLREKLPEVATYQLFSIVVVNMWQREDLYLCRQVVSRSFQAHGLILVDAQTLHHFLVAMTAGMNAKFQEIWDKGRWKKNNENEEYDKLFG